MAEGRVRSEWARTTAQMALLANCHRDPKRGRLFKPADFDPFTERRDVKAKVGIEVLKDVFINHKVPEGVQ